MMKQRCYAVDDPGDEHSRDWGAMTHLAVLGPGARSTTASVRVSLQPISGEHRGLRGRVTVRGVSTCRGLLLPVATEIQQAVADAVGLGPPKRARVFHTERPWKCNDGELVLGSIAGSSMIIDVSQRGRPLWRSPTTVKALSRTIGLAVTRALHRVETSAEICVLARVPTVAGLGGACPDGSRLCPLLPVRFPTGLPVIVALPGTLSQEQIESPPLPGTAWFSLALDGEQALQLLRVVQGIERVTRRRRGDRSATDAAGLYAALQVQPHEMTSWAVQPYGTRSSGAPRNLFMALDDHSAVVLIGDLGSGKTASLTTYRDLCLRQVGGLDPEVREATGFPTLATAAVPVVVNLPSVAAPDGPTGTVPTLEDAVIGQMRGMGLSSRDARRLLRLGVVRLLLDSLNEIPADRYQEMAAEIHRLRETWPSCPLVVATRPHGFQPLDFSAFTALHLMALDDHGQRRLLGQSGIGLAEQVSEAIAKSATLQTLAGTPLYLRMLQRAYVDEGHLPTDLGELMDKCVQGALRTMPQPLDPCSLSAAYSIIARYAGLAVDRCLATQLPVELAREHLMQARDQVASCQTVPPWMAELDAEGLLRMYLTCGLLTQKDYHVAFPHQSFRDSLAARLFVSETEDLSAAAFSRLADAAWDEACISLVLFAPPEGLAGLLQTMAARDIRLAIRALKRASSERVTSRAEAAVVAALEGLAMDPRLAPAHRRDVCAALGAAFVEADGSTVCPATLALERLCVATDVAKSALEALAGTSAPGAAEALLRLASRPKFPAWLFATAMAALAAKAQPETLLPLVVRRWGDLPSPAAILAAMPPEAGEMTGQGKSRLARRLAWMILRDESAVEHLRGRTGWDWLPTETRAESVRLTRSGLGSTDVVAVAAAIEDFQKLGLVELAPEVVRLAAFACWPKIRDRASRAVRAVAAMPATSAGARGRRVLKVVATEVTADSLGRGSRLLSILLRPGDRDESVAAALALRAAAELPDPVTTGLLEHLRSASPGWADPVTPRVLGALAGKRGPAAEALLKSLCAHGDALGDGTEHVSQLSHELVWAAEGSNFKVSWELVRAAYTSAWRVMLAIADCGGGSSLVWGCLDPAQWGEGRGICSELLTRLLLARDPFSLRTALLVGSSFTTVPAGVIPDPLLNEWLQSFSSNDRYRAVVLAAKIGGPDALPELSSVISEASPWQTGLLTEACKAVAMIGRRSPEAGDTAILLFLLHRDKLLRHVALPLVEALLELARDRPDLCDTLFEMLVDDMLFDDAARDKLADLLGTLGAAGGAAGRFLQFLADCPGAPPAPQVARALGGCGDIHHAACLIAIAADDRVQEALRDAAYSGEKAICDRTHERPTDEQLANGKCWWQEAGVPSQPDW